MWHAQWDEKPERIPAVFIWRGHPRIPGKAVAARGRSPRAHTVCSDLLLAETRPTYVLSVLNVKALRLGFTGSSIPSATLGTTAILSRNACRGRVKDGESQT